MPERILTLRKLRCNKLHTKKFHRTNHDGMTRAQNMDNESCRDVAIDTPVRYSDPCSRILSCPMGSVPAHTHFRISIITIRYFGSCNQRRMRHQESRMPA
jgi:hypothetical protein